MSTDCGNGAGETNAVAPAPTDVEEAKEKEEGRGVGVMWVKALTGFVRVFMNKTNRKAMDVFRDLAVQMNRQELSGLTYTEVLGGLSRDTALHQSRDFHVSADYLHMNDPASQELVRKAYHFIKFANATFGWGGLVTLGLASKKDAHPDAKNDVFDRVDAVVTHCKVPRGDVHGFFFQAGDTLCPTHILASDESTRSLVVGVRGTMSVADALSDVQGEPFRLDGVGLPDAACHKGFYECAMAVWANIRDKVVTLLAEPRRRGWKLVCTGHSMGAGVATILTVILRQSLLLDSLVVKGADNDDAEDNSSSASASTSSGDGAGADAPPVRTAWSPLVTGLPSGLHVEAWSFAPPPTFSSQKCFDEDTNNAIKSFVNDDDIVCRASLGGVRELGRRLRVLAFVRRAKGLKNFLELDEHARMHTQRLSQDADDARDVDAQAFTEAEAATAAAAAEPAAADSATPVAASGSGQGGGDNSSRGAATTTATGGVAETAEERHHRVGEVLRAAKTTGRGRGRGRGRGDWGSGSGRGRGRGMSGRGGRGRGGRGRGAGGSEGGEWEGDGQEEGEEEDDEAKKYIVVFKKTREHSEAAANDANVLTWDKLVAIERDMPGYRKVEGEKMYVQGRIFHIHSYPCEETKGHVDRIGALTAPQRLALEVRKKQQQTGAGGTKKACDSCDTPFGFFEIRERCSVCKQYVCHRCHSGSILMPLQHWKPTKSCRKCEAHYLAKMHAAKRGVVRMEETTADLIDSGFTFNLNLFPAHFPNKYENSFKLLLDEWDRCIEAAVASKGVAAACGGGGDGGGGAAAPSLEPAAGAAGLGV